MGQDRETAQVSLCGLGGNGMVVWFLGFHMKKSPFTVYILNLAITDLSLLRFLLVILPLDMVIEISCSPLYNYIFSKYLPIDLFLLWYFTSMYLLAAMSMERCPSVLFPIWYRGHRPKCLSGIVGGVIWFLLGLFVCLFFLGCYSPFNMNCRHIFLQLGIANFFIFSFFPFLSNLTLLIRLRYGSQRRHPGRLFVAILLNDVIVFFAFGFPLTAVMFLDSMIDLNIFYPYISYLLASLNSSINLVIYFLVGSYRQRRFQDSVKVTFYRVFAEKATCEEGSQGPSDTAVETTVITNPVSHFLARSNRHHRLHGSGKVTFRQAFAEKATCGEGSQVPRATAAEIAV
ncbi:LOW QUALITY PROTEIN: proto-oncogene Mas-like [Apteryx mantelli]|uniref:LOW QUALITY PROTEIN: proto-oncogene Mas-like n=1 Tax=Apteryx mantelli TaxID=2696672 RepID=A0ABM4EF87_9AVES